MEQVQKILAVAGEGGGLNIYGVKRDGRWFFKLVTDDHTPTLVDEEPIHQESGWFGSLAKVLSEVRWPWNCLYPIEVHPEFGAAIFKIKCRHDKKRQPDKFCTREWARLCGVPQAMPDA